MGHTGRPLPSPTTVLGTENRFVECIAALATGKELVGDPAVMYTAIQAGRINQFMHRQFGFPQTKQVELRMDAIWAKVSAK